ncbi:MAG: protein translocase subunit SecD [Gammaproteobacteria bacterium]|nr:protein translocase subunit SecD [Gammaproteobacteria bacterium]
MKANQYPWWKNLLVIGIPLIAALYAAPNLYPSDPSVQVSSSRVAIGEAERKQVEQILKLKGLGHDQVEQEGEESLLIRFADPEDQLKAADALRDALSDRFSVALHLAPATPGWLESLNAHPMNLGLDLRGGVHFLLEVDLDASISKAYTRHATDVRTLLREEEIRYRGVRVHGEEVHILARDAETLEQIEEVVKDNYFGTFDVTAGETEGQPSVIMRLTQTAHSDIRRNAISQNLITLRKRVNELGVAEPVIQQQGRTRIAVQLPGVQDTARAKEILGATATLEFRLVDEQSDPYLAAETGKVPLADELYYERDGNPVLLKRRVMLTGEHIIDASSGFDERGLPAVHITLDSDGARQFAKVTGENVKRLMGVVFIEQRSDTVVTDGETHRITRESREVINVARIQEQLSKRFQITGLDTSREARNLALLLRAGALATPMYIVEERTVGPSLGQQNIELGALSVLIGFLLVMVFMTLYYRLFGLVADLALIANLVLIVAAMSMIPGATLTLPGIAGIVLTVGMAVDANVLIFERIREELDNGNSPQASIQAGYSKALSTIADANITTLIAAIVLFAFGTGPIKGFAVTLSIGIVASMFTAIMGTRAIINRVYGTRRSPTLAV